MASGQPISRSVVIASVPSAISDLCVQILSEMEAENFSQEDVFAVHLALEEAFLNAVEHGNKMDARKKILVKYSVDAQKVEISMADQGNGFDPESVPDPRSGENLYKAEGRGLLLMRSYMDLVEFDKVGSCVNMVRYKEKPTVTNKPGREKT